mgnify:FL=1
MLNGKTITIRQLIDEVYRDKKYKYELPWQDAIEWSVDAVELIGVPTSLTPRVARITIASYRGHLPCDLHSITQAAGSFSGRTPFPMTSNTNSFHSTFTCATDCTIEELITSTTSNAAETPIGQDISGNPVYEFDFGNSSMPETITDTSTTQGSTLNPVYSVSDNFIFTNFEEGYVFLAYKAFPVDDDGFPMIPDNRRFKEAVKAFICYKIDYILWRTRELTKDVYQDSEQQWLFYVASAATAAHTPNRDQMQSLLNQMKLVPNRYAHSNFFRTLGS